MMRTLTAMVALLSLLSNALAAPTVARSETTDRGRYDHFDNFPSGKVISRNVVVFIPSGPPPDSGYAVLYMHDGHNLFDPAQAMGHEPWAADQAIAQGHFPLILVAIDNTSLRWPEYVPLNAYAALPEELALAAQGSEPTPRSDAYVDFIADELKPFIDAHYPTRSDATHTFIAGSSMGGLISIYAMERRPDIFGGAAGLSTHWPATTNFALFGNGPDSADPRLAEIANLTVDTLADQLPNPRSHRLWVDYGDQTLDQFYAPYAHRFDDRARRNGWSDTLSVRAYPGTAHNEASWRSRFPEVLEFLLRP